MARSNTPWAFQDCVHYIRPTNLRPFHRLVTIWLLLLAGTCYATQPLMDRLEYEGEQSIVSPRGRPWLELPENEKTQEIRLQARCSAIGAPRAEWKVSDSRLWLVGLFKCGGDIKLEAVYGGNGEPMLAEWITADLVIQRGKRFCRWHYGGPEIKETSIFIKVERGVVTHIAHVSHKDDQAIPTVEKLRKLFGPKEAHKAEEMVAVWPCLDENTLRQLGIDPSTEPTPKWITYKEYLSGHVGKRDGQ